MKKSFLSIMSLLLVISVSSSSLAQVVFTKKRLETPVIAAPSPETLEGAEISGRAEILEGTAYSDGGSGVLIKWNTAMEIDIIGFNLLRVDGAGNRVPVNSSLIGGSIMRHGSKLPQNSGSMYTWYDTEGNSGSQYFIESVSIQGGKTLYGPVSPLRIKNLSAKMGFDPKMNPELASRENGTIEKNFPAGMTVANSNTAPSAEMADPVKQKWVAAQPGVKLQIRKNGFYRVSRAALETAGFNVAAAPEFWQLYADGEEQKMIVEPAGNYIEFYGKGIDNQNSDSRYYYLLVGPQPGQRITSMIRRGFGPPALGRSFRSITTFEERINYIDKIKNGDADNWFGAILAPNSPTTRNVNLKNVDGFQQKAIVEITLHGFLSGAHNVQVSCNGTPMGTVVYDGLVPATKEFVVNASHLVNGNNSFEFTGLAGPGDFNLLKSIKINYPRFYVADQNTLAFETVGNQATKVTGFDTPNVRVFDMVFANDPQLIINTSAAPGANGFDVSIPSGRPHPMLAVSDNALLSPVAITLNTPSQMSSGTSNAHMLIVSHANFMAGANSWATYRRADALNVDVINVEDVYDEFDYGLPTPLALKGFLQYAKTNYPNFKYVMFVGDATYDPRNYTGAGYNDFIPTKFVVTDEGEAPSDETIGDFNNDAVAEMAIGRLPVRVNASVTLLLGKLSAFEPGVPTALQNRGTLFVADEPIGYPFADVNRRLYAELPPTTPVNFIDLEGHDAVDIRSQIISTSNSGKFLVNYTGHGAPGIWSSKQILRMADVPLLTNNNGNLSMFFMLTCLNGYFVDPSNDWLAESLLKSPNGGAAVVWASTGSTTPDIQDIMATRFFHLFGQGTYNRLGDAIKDAKQNAPNQDVPLTWVLFGDPALHIK